MKNNLFNLPSSRRTSQIVSTLLKYHKLWIIPAVAGIVLSAVFVMFLRSETWSAKQSLMMRDDLMGQSYKPGRFDSLESMRSAQETILEIARKPQVIRNVLQELGPEPGGKFKPGGSDESWPSEEVIETVQGTITLGAPNGAEFGRTEVVILNTKASSRERSREFIELLLSEIIAKMNEVRARRLLSMEHELIQARDAALIALEQSKDKLRSMDRQLGPDVDAMNALNDQQGRENPIKRDMSQIEMEKRIVESEIETAVSVLDMLITARNNPHEPVNISSDLISRQPALEFLKRELVVAQGKLATSKGDFTDEHPRVKSGYNEVEEIQQCIFRELNSAIDGMKVDVAVFEQRVRRLDQDVEALDARLVMLGENRADFLTLTFEVKQRNEIVNRAQSDLAEIQGLASLTNANLLTPVDDPQVSTRPDELGKKATVLAGGFGGLLIGLGLVMLVALPMDPTEPVAGTTARSVDTNQTARPSREPADSRQPSSKLVSDSLDSAAKQNKPGLPRKGKTIQIVPVPVKKVPVERVPSQSVPVRGVQRNGDTPLQPSANVKPRGKDPVGVGSAFDKTLPAKPTFAEQPPVTPQTSFAGETSPQGAIVDEAFEWPIKVDKNAIPETETPVPPKKEKTAVFQESAAADQPVKRNQPGNQTASAPTRGRRAIIVNRSQSDAELKRRPSSVRPIDLVKSVEADIQQKAVKDPKDSSHPRQSKSAQKFEPETGSNSPRKEEAIRVLIDQETSTGIKTDRSFKKSEKPDETDLPVPDQIKKLSDTIANFAKPVVMPKSSESENDTF